MVGPGSFGDVGFPGQAKCRDDRVVNDARVCGPVPMRIALPSACERHVAELVQRLAGPVASGNSVDPHGSVLMGQILPLCERCPASSSSGTGSLGISVLWRGRRSAPSWHRCRGLRRPSDGPRHGQRVIRGRGSACWTKQWMVVAKGVLLGVKGSSCDAFGDAFNGVKMPD